MSRLSTILPRISPISRQVQRRWQTNLSQFDIFEAMDVRVDANVGKRIDRVLESGIMVGGVEFRGPVILVGGKVFYWNVPQWGLGKLKTEEGNIEGGLMDGWSEQVFSIFKVLDNPPEMLVLGTGSQVCPLPSSISSSLHKMGIQVEIQKTRSAASTYNVLLDEGRLVAAAMLPILPTSAMTNTKFKLK